MIESARLTIAHILGTPGTTWGGMEKHTANLTEALAARGHNIHVLAHKNYRNHFSANVIFHPLPTQLGRRNLWLHIRLRQNLQRIIPDIVHAQGNKAASLIQSLPTRYGTKFGTIHGTKSSHRPFSGFAGIIAVSNEIRDSVPERQCRVIYNGVPSQTSSLETSQKRPETTPYAIAIGRLEPVKQFDKLITAWAELKPPLPLYILGTGSEQRKLQRIINRYQVAHLVQLVGYESNVQPWLQSAALCIISSEREGFPYVLVESLLLECPVLSTPVSGACEILPRACLADATDTHSIKKLLALYFQNPEAIKEQERECFTLARQELTLETMAARTEAFYQDILAHRPEITPIRVLDE